MERVHEDSRSAACISPSPQAEGHTVQRKDTGQGLLAAGMNTQGCLKQWVTDQKKEPASHCPKIQFPQMKVIMLFFSQLKKRRYCRLADSISFVSFDFL